MARWQALSALGGLPRSRMGDDAGRRYRRSAQPEIQSPRRARQADVERRLDEMGPRHPAKPAGALKRRDGLLHLPSVMDDELRRLPPADRGQPEDRAAP